MITVNNVSKTFRRNEVLHDVSMAFEPGKVVGLSGPNGSGKTMLMRIVAGLVKPTVGTVEVAGKVVGRDVAFPPSLGLLLEGPTFIGGYSGFDNLKALASIRDVVDDEGIRAWIERVGLDPADRRHYRKYSLGMKQRLGLAGALLGYPKLLILDEPTNGLDPAGIQEMRELILELPERFGMTVVVSSHLLSEIDQIAGHVGIIREGELVFQDSMAALHGRSTHHLELRTENDPAAARLLRARGIEADIQDGRLTLPVLTDGETAEAVRALVESRVGVLRLEERQKSLEDIFLELTGRAASL